MDDSEDVHSLTLIKACYWQKPSEDREVIYLVFVDTLDLYVKHAL